ncbi:S-type pyocin domain-containing protein [Enterobacter asburiae]|uniref:S-type pyocin domain-containing protein n=1 Tax=Scandinavium sp. UTDF21-P1B TaxID=3446379 RepID=UPI00346978E5
MAIIPAYYKDGIPYDSNGKAIVSPSGNPLPEKEPLVISLGDGKYKFRSKKKACYQMYFQALGMQWVMDRDDGKGVAMCYATDTEKHVAINLMTGQMPVPEFTPEQAQGAISLLGGPGILALNSGQEGIQFAVAGDGVMGIAGELLSTLAAAISRAVSLLTASTAGPMVAAASTILFSPSAGQGSDRIPGRDVEAMVAMNARMMVEKRVSIEPGTPTVNLPIRGALINQDGQMALTLIKTGEGAPSEVLVLESVRDTSTGLDVITLPAMGGEPSRTILINPVPAPSTPSDTGNQAPAPVIPQHTGTAVKPVDTITVTTFPGADAQELYDFIYWRPDAAGTGVEPVYVIISRARDMEGTVTGRGQTVGDNWLYEAGKGTGVPIPAQITEKLRGRKFANFDAFRRAFWTEAGKDPDLLKQLKSQNKTSVKNGKSPFVPVSERVGGRRRFELHHVNLIKDNGAVYDIDNIRVITPKRHIEIHKEGK